MHSVATDALTAGDTLGVVPQTRRYTTLRANPTKNCPGKCHCLISSLQHSRRNWGAAAAGLLLNDHNSKGTTESKQASSARWMAKSQASEARDSEGRPIATSWADDRISLPAAGREKEPLGQVYHILWLPQRLPRRSRDFIFPSPGYVLKDCAIPPPYFIVPLSADGNIYVICSNVIANSYFMSKSYCSHTEANCICIFTRSTQLIRTGRRQKSFSALKEIKGAVYSKKALWQPYDHLENDLNVVCLENTKNCTTSGAFAGPLRGWKLGLPPSLPPHFFLLGQAKKK